MLFSANHGLGVSISSNNRFNPLTALKASSTASNSFNKSCMDTKYFSETSIDALMVDERLVTAFL